MMSFAEIKNSWTGFPFSPDILIAKPTRIEVTSNAIKLFFESNSGKSGTVITETVLSKIDNFSVSVSVSSSVWREVLICSPSSGSTSLKA